MSMNIKSFLKRFSKQFLRRVFEVGQKIGVDILPRHFYSEIPNIGELRNSNEWKQAYSMKGVNGIDSIEQISFIRQCCTDKVSGQLQQGNIHQQACEKNGAQGFGKIESEFLFAFIVRHQPKQIFQIGCGVSTAVCLAAAEFCEYTPEIICVEPYPTPYLTDMQNQGKVNLIRKKVQNLDMEYIDQLRDDLLFFVDSTHTLGPAGEVGRIILEMLPRLKKDAWVHFHDIYFPYDYDRGVLDSALFFQHESILLHGFLAFNSKFEIAASFSMLHYAEPKSLGDVFPSYHPGKNDDGLGCDGGDFPSSVYLRVID